MIAVNPFFMFTSIAPRYDLLNHVLSFNVDRLWWRRTARVFQHILSRQDARVLDLCCGTGDMTFALRRRAIVDHILAVATPDYWGCFLSCRVAYRASGHKRRKDIFILVCLKPYQLLLPVG